MKTLRIAALAEEELREAQGWYEEQSPGLGDRLIHAVDQILLRVREQPGLFPVVHRDIHRALLRPFPYGVFFREEGKEVIRVIAIVHLHRHPDTWKRR
jgi:plasmid stabilization system protein ParE